MARKPRTVITDIRHQVLIGLEPELQQAIAQYHQTVRPGMPAMLTFRELLWLGLGARPDVAIHNALQRGALVEIRSYLMERSAAYMNSLAAELPQHIAGLLEQSISFNGNGDGT